MACEKCCADAYLRSMSHPEKTQAEHYHDLLEERKVFDGAPSNLNNSIWGGLVRQLDRDLLGNNWQQSWANVPQSMSYLQLVTWNDYEEGTALEGMFGMFV